VRHAAFRPSHWRAFGFAAGLLCSLICGGIAVQAKDPTTAPDGHASLSAYPDAVITATDDASGITVSVEADGKTLTARDAAGTILWQADVLARTGPPSTGFPVVRRIDIAAGGKLTLVVGKQRVVEADLKTGAMKLLGEN
jgi:hypothetical protein